ncbi:MAG: hypothetical protein ACFFAH_13935, partial [Promethearchaeota archaeon]
DIQKRQNLYEEILNFLRELNNLERFNYEEYDSLEGIIPVVYFNKSISISDAKCIKIFIGAQHNEYNGLFGILHFLKRVQNKKILINELMKGGQVLIFFPLMNPYGFLNPSKDNKSGYYLKNGTNLNRFWRRTFVPEYNKINDDEIEYPIPEHAKIVKKKLKKYWEIKNLPIYILDFHETSLLERFPKALSMDLKKESITYKFDHWLKEGIIQNIMELYDIKYYKKPLFFKCSPKADHNHISLSIKQLDTVFEKLLEYMTTNKGKLHFYFCYSDKSKDYCEKIANIIYIKLKEKLWETKFPSVNHRFHDHGCLVKMGDATSREKVYSIELESQKQFFNLFEEIEKSKTNPDYFEEKLNLINISLELVVESILTLINTF